MRDVDENTRNRVQIPEGAMRLIKRGDSPLENLDESQIKGEYEVVKKKPE